MREEYQGFIEQVKSLNQVLHEKYDALLNMESQELKEKLIPTVGVVETMEKMGEEELKNIGLIVGVDGSTVRMGGAHPHYVEIFQGLAKTTTGEDCFTQRIYTPLLGTQSEEDGNKIHNQFLAEVEVDAAIAAIEEHHPDIIIMDGGLLRYRIDCGEKWQKLQEICEREEIKICGAIKDIKTNMISEALGFGQQFYDREILAGKLERGEIFLVHEEQNTKGKEGFSSAFYRPSKHNEVVGIDVLQSQKENLKDLCRLLYTLTPRESRGVPYWMDIVDKECKVTPALLETLLQENMDRGLLERFFVSERDRRN
ncbi:DNA double-strand break repair nuclease NurA [Peptoniphilus sp. KCTC 25270]|uniref:DNA double-strand break repair nuclease NurA n=1 Tax=Peptoniphilus sp. KCTC 25270 TaxID=2897414 RepID=UPI001E5406E4|nr:DNA double-strand break repair nuclease NurA [Peptoniphilus sp. KCTC 25270]MCD1147569.1 DNA double-strand break repair nuclease NurA [Peptoniphilus sp. KCTC 25270]